jgi:hypothetical protein
MRRSWGVGALMLAAVAFVAYPAVRPWEDESTQDGALRAMSSTAWVASHFFAMLGFILVALGVLALRDALAGTRSAGLAGLAVVVTWIGSGLTLTYYGAEDFGLSAVARVTAEGTPIDLVAFKELRFGALAMTAFGVGLMLLAVGGVLAAIAVWRSGTMARASGVVFAIGYLLFLPQFFTPPAVRIAHGIVLGVGLVWLAIALRGARPVR